MKCKEISIKLSLFLLVFLFLSCWQKEIWDKSKQPIDDIAPALNSAVPLSNSILEVVFSEQMDEATAEDPLNYSIPGLTVTNAVRDDVDYSIVRLTTSSQLYLEYELTVTNVLDEYLNEIDLAQNTILFFGDALPGVVSAAAVDNTHVRVVFSEDVEQTSAEDEGNYSILDYTTGTVEIEVTSSTLVSNNTVELVTESHPDVQDYVITVTGLEDLTGNLIDLWDTIQAPDPSRKEAIFTGDALPYVSSVYPTDNTHIQIMFSEDVMNADIFANYTASLNIYSPIVTISGNIVEIETYPQDKVTYTLKVSNIQDLTYNFIDPSLQYSFTGDALPYLISVTALSATQVQVVFSEAVEKVSAETISNYNITGSPTVFIIGVARLSAPNSNIVNIDLDPTYPLNGTYNLEALPGIIDEDHGNIIGTPNNMSFNW